MWCGQNWARLPCRLAACPALPCLAAWGTRVFNSSPRLIVMPPMRTWCYGSTCAHRTTRTTVTRRAYITHRSNTHRISVADSWALAGWSRSQLPDPDRGGSSNRLLPPWQGGKPTADWA
jgi:hypothetical protein